MNNAVTIVGVATRSGPAAAFHVVGSEEDARALVAALRGDPKGSGYRAARHAVRYHSRVVDVFGARLWLWIVIDRGEP